MNPSWIHLGGLFPTPLYHLGGLFPTPLYHLHPCRRTSLQARARKVKMRFPPCFKIND